MDQCWQDYFLARFPDCLNYFVSKYYSHAHIAERLIFGWRCQSFTARSRPVHRVTKRLAIFWYLCQVNHRRIVFLQWDNMVRETILFSASAHFSHSHFVILNEKGYLLINMSAHLYYMTCVKLSIVALWYNIRIFPCCTSRIITQIIALLILLLIRLLDLVGG